MNRRGTPFAAQLAAALAGALPFAAALALFFGALAVPGTLLATRDMLEFHLPLRTAWAALASVGDGYPQWDPFAHGGQPLLSNPNYGAVYPPSWIGRWLSPVATLALLALLHAAIAMAGAYRLARAVGADRASARLAGVAFACGGTYLPLLHSLTLAFGMAWFPWVLAFAFERLEPHPSAEASREARRSKIRASLGLALCLALAILAGEPVLAALLGLALLFVIAAEPRRIVQRAAALLPPIGLGVALAAAQVVPALARLADSPRGEGLAAGVATGWSMSPWRAVELFFPRIFGDIARPMQGLYFGWGIHDRDFPYILLVSVSLPLVLAAIPAIATNRLPRPLFWWLLAASGIFLALGRHNPLYELLRRRLPGMSALRYPEKFALLTLVALVVCGGLAWKRLLDERERGPARGAELPMALAGLAAIAAAAAAVALRIRPALLEPFLAAHSGWELSSAESARAIAFFRDECLTALALALATFALFAAARWSRLPRRTLEAGLLLVVASELWIHSRPLLRTAPADRVLAPPAALVAGGFSPLGVGPLGEEVSRAPRLFSTEEFQAEANDLVPRSGDLVANWTRAPIERLGSRTGNLFGFRYALDKDFDLSLTGPAQRALALYERLRQRPALAHRLLGAWSVETLVIQRAPPSLVDELKRGVVGPAPVALAANSFALPTARFVAGFESFESAAAAEAAAIAAGLPLDSTEFLIGRPPGAPAMAVAALHSDVDRGDRRTIGYASAAPSLLVVASTYDRGWRATVDDLPVPLFETAGGYQAMVVPPGRHEVALDFRDPWFAVGASITLAALLVALILAVRGRPERDPAAR